VNEHGVAIGNEKIFTVERPGDLPPALLGMDVVRLVLERARDANAIPHAAAELLVENYRQLRRVEGILRRWSFEGETVLPLDPAPYYRVSIRCGFASPEAFRAAIAKYRQAIRTVYTKVFGKVTEDTKKRKLTKT